MSVGNAARKDEGKWIVMTIDARVLSIGFAQYRGQAARTQLDPVARATVLTAVKRLGALVDSGAAVSGFDQDSTAFGVKWPVKVVPVVGPRTVRPVAWVCRYGEAADPPPIVGAWEWLVPADATARPGPRMWWSPAMHFLYHSSPDADQLDSGGRTWWYAAQYFDRHIGYSFQARLRREFERTLQGPPNALRIESFVKGDWRSDDRSVLRQVGWRADAPRFGVEPGTELLRGVTTKVDRESDADLELTDGLQDLAGAYMSMAGPHAFIDTATETLWKRSGEFKGLGLHVGPEGRVRDLCHPGDYDRLMAELVRTAAHHGAPGLRAARALPSDPVRCRFATDEEGAYRTLWVRAMAVRITTYPHHVLAFFSEAHPAG